jgi:hypothetical protein
MPKYLIIDESGDLTQLVAEKIDGDLFEEVFMREKTVLRVNDDGNFERLSVDLKTAQDAWTEVDFV